MSYLENKKSIAGSNTAEIIRKIAYRYIDDNKPCEFYAAPSVKSVFRQQTNGMFDINFDAVYPDAKIGSYAYALMYILSERDMSVTVSVRLSRGAEIRINGECIAKTTVDDELTGRKRDIRVNVKKGKNPVFIKAKKTALGFGAEFGEACIAWKPIYMYYCDMLLHTTTGWYKSDISREFVNYPMPQEHGNHTGCKVLQMNDGLHFAARDKMEINVSGFDSGALTRARHTDELRENGFANVRIDYKNSGIGSNSCGPVLKEEYRLSEKDIRFEFYIS